MTSILKRHGILLVAAGLVLAVLVVAPGLGLLWRIAEPVAGNPFALSATQMHAVRETAMLMAGVALFTGVIGVSTAWLVSVHEFPGRCWLEIGLVLPLAFPTYLAAYVAVDLFDFFGPVQSAMRAIIGPKPGGGPWLPDLRSLPGAVVILGLVLLPYVYIPCRILYSRTGRNVIEAARLLGANGASLFFRVGLPIAKPALLAGGVLALLETLNDIGAVEYLGVSSLSAVIRDLWLNRNDLAGAARLAGLMVLLVAALLLIDPRARTGRTERQAKDNSNEPRRVRLRGVFAFAATAFCALPVLFGFLFPALHLLTRAFVYLGSQRVDAELFHAILSTMTLGLSVSLFVVAAGALIAIAQRTSGRFSRLGTLAMLGYAAPATVLVLAMMPVIGLIDSGVARAGLPYLFIGSSAAMLYALTARFLGIGATQAGLALARLPTNVDAVARIHGLGDLALAWRIHRPAIAPGLKLGVLLVFIDTVKELPATLLLRPLNFETLATRAYSKASAGLFEHGAIDSLLIVAISGAAALLLSRRA
ncbi:MAG: iron ABC transporter permease [Beijerinckiaceae bacterium]|nr:iron ABC transporter permease [Beijerinckiaceae bacterium]